MSPSVRYPQGTLQFSLARYHLAWGCTIPLCHILLVTALLGFTRTTAIFAPRQHKQLGGCGLHPIKIWNPVQLVIIRGSYFRFEQSPRVKTILLHNDNIFKSELTSGDFCQSDAPIEQWQCETTMTCIQCISTHSVIQHPTHALIRPSQGSDTVNQTQGWQANDLEAFIKVTVSITCVHTTMCMSCTYPFTAWPMRCAT